MEAVLHQDLRLVGSPIGAHRERLYRRLVSAASHRPGSPECPHPRDLAQGAGHTTPELQVRAAP
jgi:hypothetical protein